MADYVDKPDVKPLPYELKLAFRCQQWNTLPNSGGLLDQPVGLVDKMTTAINCYDALSAWKKREPGKDLEFSKNNPSAWKIIQHVIELRAHG